MATVVAENPTYTGPNDGGGYNEKGGQKLPGMQSVRESGLLPDDMFIVAPVDFDPSSLTSCKLQLGCLAFVAIHEFIFNSIVSVSSLTPPPPPIRIAIYCSIQVITVSTFCVPELRSIIEEEPGDRPASVASRKGDEDKEELQLPPIVSAHKTGMRGI